MGFEDIEETSVHTLKNWADRIHLSGRFDINLEMENIGGESSKGLALSLMAGEVASLLLSRIAVPMLYYATRSQRSPSIGEA